MIIKKTDGYMDDERKRKGYIIYTECGSEFTLRPLGSQGFEHEGTKWKTKKSFKDFVEEGGLENLPYAETSTMDGEDTWDCTHPCALLISSNVDNLMEPTFSRFEMETLGSYGWVDEIGQPDIARAEREIKRVQVLKNAN